jgi:hypothetical protein
MTGKVVMRLLSRSLSHLTGAPGSASLASGKRRRKAEMAMQVSSRASADPTQ